MTEQEKTLTQRLDDLFYSRFGDDWRREISITLRADAIHWLVYLCEKGIKAAAEEFKQDRQTRPAEAAASLASWHMDLENLVQRVEMVLVKPKPKKK